MLDRYGVLNGRMASASNDEAADDRGDDAEESGNGDFLAAGRIDMAQIVRWADEGYEWEEIEGKVDRMLDGKPY